MKPKEKIAEDLRLVARAFRKQYNDSLLPKAGRQEPQNDEEPEKGR